MTTSTKRQLPNGDKIEIRTNPGAAPIITRNGVRDPSLKITDFDKDIKWQPIRIWIPRKINGRWYAPGSRVFRRRSFAAGGVYWQYGDEFDVLREL
jgi:hypothetical protein